MTQPVVLHSLFSGFVDSCERFATRDALVVDGETLTYDELARHVAAISAAVNHADRGDSGLAALLGQRSVTAFAGVLGILGSGRGYVPLNPKFPSERLGRMLALSGCEVVIVGIEGLEPLAALLQIVEKPTCFVLPNRANVEELRSQYPQHRFEILDVSQSHTLTEPAIDAESVAYLLFTSGSTGEPKGVAVRHGNVCPYVDYVCDLLEVNEHDRFSQHFDLTFDLSVHDMFVCWQRGACLCCVPEKAVIAPAKFIRDQKLTMWFSVPSAVGFLQRMRILKPDAFPTLRWSLFCGEPLPGEFARAWQEAAPNSIVENFYGPTEATIAITRYRWDSVETPGACVNGIVPIGKPFDGQRVTVVDKDSKPVAVGESGELLLGGSQVTGQYWNNPEKTAERFTALPDGSDGIWYRTGDLVKQDDAGCLYFMGRTDDQVKIRGYRVELQEIDHVLRRAAGTQEAVAVAWPVRLGSADGVIAFVCGTSRRDVAGIIAECKKSLPEYMVPRKVHFVDELPLNVNGKVDRKRLVLEMEEGDR